MMLQKQQNTSMSTSLRPLSFQVMMKGYDSKLLNHNQFLTFEISETPIEDEVPLGKLSWFTQFSIVMPSFWQTIIVLQILSNIDLVLNWGVVFINLDK